MTRKIKKEDAETLISGWIRDIEEQKEKILKHFEDMDLKNADIREVYEERIEAITTNCDDLIAEMRSYNFN
ncbi:hypothetical protein NNC19_18540 [Clostridium sp. SHJSY1]|uniref:hypothetical protein n=1 Tax=Clostridium sp. SHJSY1 TaxID=2942483 RepID=UPI0028762DE2|nr:hypothetical protein [Clostridium sp. SHJSY1]MDS0527691.1 hypothetical protein [Clostridium sp. SHJSY1]